MTANPPILKAPFPYPGGKSKVADMVWERLGDVRNFIEPFAGTCAVTLRRPAEHFADGYRVETINDVNGYIVNFWRAVRNAPDEVAKWADNPVLEADLHARHKWLVRSKEATEWKKLMASDPECFDAKIAGWWCWGICCWIGSGWCQERMVNSQQIPEIGGGTYGPSQRGVHMPMGRPQLTDAYDIGRGVNASPPHLPEKRPLFSDGRLGHGVNTVAEDKHPAMSFNSLGCGVNNAPWLGTCDARRLWLTDWMRRLSDRLRLVRTCYGHWSRICDSDSTLTRLGTTGVFIDAPYPTRRADGTKSRDGSLYASDKNDDTLALRDEVLSWCRKWGGNPEIRIGVCGYEGDGYEALEGWTVVAWESNGGYGNQRKKGGKKSENAARERLWFSPACLVAAPAPTLFDGLEDEC